MVLHIIRFRLYLVHILHGIRLTLLEVNRKKQVQVSNLRLFGP